MLKAMNVVNALGDAGLFRVRDLKRRGISPNWMPFFHTLFDFVHHGHGVWSRGKLAPTRYEILQFRFPQSVFWGPSALWLLGEMADEPPELWIAIDNKARPPRTLHPTTVVIRTRRLNDDVVEVRPQGRRVALRVHTAARARADLLARELRAQN